MKALGIVPARFSSSRFPGKPLAMIAGKTMIQRVCERAGMARSLSGVIVATDDDRIFSCVSSFGGKALMTSPACASGTDRIAEASAALDAEVILNIQGDEPLLEPAALDLLVSLFENDPNLRYGTLVTPVVSENELASPNVVKTVMDRNDNCLYFSRSPIPFLRGLSFRDVRFWRHIGIYGFRRDFLFEFGKLPQGDLEKAESLEQLRAIENGVPVKAARIPDWRGISVDAPEDLVAVEEIIKKGG